MVSGLTAVSGTRSARRSARSSAGCPGATCPGSNGSPGASARAGPGPDGLLFLVLGTRWQQELRVRLDMERLETYDILRLVGVGVLTFAVLLLIARLLRLGTRLDRPAARPVGAAAGGVRPRVCSSWLPARRRRRRTSLRGNLLAVAEPDRVGDQRPHDRRRRHGAARRPALGQPGVRRRLGHAGPAGPRRSSATGADRSASSTAFAGRPATRADPGVRRASTRRRRRRGARRSWWCASWTGPARSTAPWSGSSPPTGTGWVDSDVTDSLEYMYAGDTALVSMQYSYLPSWISFMVDRSKVSGDGAGADRRRARPMGRAGRRRRGRSCCCSARASARTVPRRRSTA